MKLTCPPKNTSPKFAHRVTRISALMKMISARNASRRRIVRHSTPMNETLHMNERLPRHDRKEAPPQSSFVIPREHVSPARNKESLTGQLGRRRCYS